MGIDVVRLTEKYGKPLSAVLSIDLSMGDPAYAKWLLASILYAKPFPEEATIGAFETLEHRGLTSPAAIADTGKDQLTIILEKNEFTRYGPTVASEAVEAFKDLVKRYDGKLSNLYDASTGSKDLERRVKSLGKGLDHVAVSVFLRDMRQVWPKADPEPSPRVKELMTTLKIGDLKEYARGHGLDLVRLETALCRYTRDQVLTQRAKDERKWKERYKPQAMR